MTIVDSEILSVTPTLADKKVLNITADLSDTLFDYDMLLKDVESSETESIKIKEEEIEEEEILTNFFSDQHEKTSSLPRLIQWNPQQGQMSSVITIMLEYEKEVRWTMRVMFGQLSVETTQQHHRMQTEDGTVFWVTLMATVPPIKETQSEGEHVPISVTLIDLDHLDRALKTIQIGFFTYTEEGVRSSIGRKRALSCEPEECLNKKNTFDSKKPTQDEVDAQLLKLLAPYDPLLNTTMSIQGSWVSTPTPPPTLSSSSVASSHDVSTWPLDDPTTFSQPNYTTASTMPSSYAPYSTAPPNHFGTHYESFPKHTPPAMYNLMPNPPLDMMLSKENMYQAFLEMQQRQRFKPAQASPMMTQTTNNYMPSFHHPNYYFQNILQQQQQQQKQYPPHYTFQRQRQFSLSDATPSPAQPPMLDVQRRASAPAHNMYTVANNTNGSVLNKAHLKLNGDLIDMMTNWTMTEWQMGRRLVHFWRETTHDGEGNLTLVECGFDPMDQQTYHQQRMRDNVAAVAAAAAAATAATSDSPSGDYSHSSRSNSTPIVISCIYWRERNDYYITSVDCIYLLESIIGIHFTVEEKNRIRRNLEGFRPLTVSKCKADCADFFKLIMSFPHPKPRNIEKDVKVFSWRTLPHALKKIIRKYTPSYITTAPLEPIHQRPSHVSIAHQHTFASSSNSTSSPQNNLGF